MAKVRFLPREIVLTTSLPFSKFSARTAMFSCDFFGYKLQRKFTCQSVEMIGLLLSDVPVFSSLALPTEVGATVLPCDSPDGLLAE